MATKEAALAAAERLSAALGAPYGTGTDRWVTTASIGVAVGPAGFRTADAVVAAADTAMYDAKGRGGGRYVLYSEALHTGSTDPEVSRPISTSRGEGTRHPDPG